MAQLEERGSHNPEVVSSILTSRISFSPLLFLRLFLLFPVPRLEIVKPSITSFWEELEITAELGSVSLHSSNRRSYSLRNYHFNLTW